MSQDPYLKLKIISDVYLGIYVRGFNQNSYESANKLRQIEQNLQKVYNRNYDRNNFPSAPDFVNIIFSQWNNIIRKQAMQIYIDAMINTYGNPDFKLDMYYIFGWSFYKIEIIKWDFDYVFGYFERRQKINKRIVRGIIESTISSQCILLLSHINLNT